MHSFEISQMLDHVHYDGVRKKKSFSQWQKTLMAIINYLNLIVLYLKSKKLSFTINYQTNKLMK